MLYQVMYRQAGFEWHEWGSPVEAYSMGYEKQRCQINHPGAQVVVVEGTTHAALREAVARQATLALPPPELDTLRERMEQGQGGDHDEPYRYRSPEGPWLSALIRLMERVQRGELEP